MGLPMSVHVRGPQTDEPRVTLAVDTAFSELRADDRLFSTYRSDSAVRRIQRGELRLGDAGPRVTTVAALCEEAAARTDGAFSAWLRGPDGRPAFDPTGLVKGWAVEQAFDRLMERLAALDAHDVLMSAGGDIVVACTRTDTPDWSIGIEDPRDRNRLLMNVPLRRGAVATSGIAARGQHIVDPSTARPPTALLSATVIGPSLTWADVYATAAFVKGAEAGAWMSAMADHACVLVGADAGVVATEAS
jgi:thiamine biosynthesis lipoprotein